MKISKQELKLMNDCFTRNYVTISSRGIESDGAGNAIIIKDSGLMFKITENFYYLSTDLDSPPHAMVPIDGARVYLMDPSEVAMLQSSIAEYDSQQKDDDGKH